MRTDWVMRSFPEEEKKQSPRQEDKPVSPALGLGLVAFFLGLPFVGKILGGILLVFGIILRAFSGALKEFFSVAPTTAAVLTGICIGLRLYYRFRGNKNNAEETKVQQPSAGTFAEEAPAPQVHHTFNPLRITDYKAMKKTAYRVPSPWNKRSTAGPDNNPEETRRMANEDVLCVRFILIPAALLILFTQLPRLSSVLSFLVSSPERLGGLITGFVTGLYLHFRAQRRTKEEKEADRASAEKEFIPRTYHTFGD